MAGVGNEYHRGDSERKLVNKEGLEIYCRYWNPATERALDSGPRCLVFVSHGAGEHSGWYKEVAEQLHSRHILVFSHDHVGHGRSEGGRLHIDDFDKYIVDVFHHIDSVRDVFPNIPVFIIGHSMGGTIAIRAALTRPGYFRGIVLIAPGVMANPETATPLRVFLARCLAWFCPQFQIEKIKPEWTCRDPTIVKKYQDDPLNYHGGLKARWAVCMLNMMSFICENMQKIDVPFLLLHGTKDMLTLFDGSKKLAEEAPSIDKTFKVYEDAYHQLHNEPGGLGQEVRNLMAEWIHDRI